MSSGRGLVEIVISKPASSVPATSTNAASKGTVAGRAPEK